MRSIQFQFVEGKLQSEAGKNQGMEERRAKWGNYLKQVIIMPQFESRFHWDKVFIYVELSKLDKKTSNFFYIRIEASASSLPICRTPFKILFVCDLDGFFVPLMYWDSKLWFIPIFSLNAFTFMTL